MLTQLFLCYCVIHTYSPTLLRLWFTSEAAGKADILFSPPFVPSRPDWLIGGSHMSRNGVTGLSGPSCFLAAIAFSWHPSILV